MLIIIWQESPEVNLNILIGFYVVGIFSFGPNTAYWFSYVNMKV